jgi:GTP diphosphokinase / guanosine-3',5'-bis(diphosphate) 3'-diphosphatase
MEEKLKRLGLTSKKDRQNFIEISKKMPNYKIDHSFKVAKIVSRYDKSKSMILAALYHDILETDIASKEELVKMTNQETVFLIESISNIKEIDIKNLPKNRQDAFYQVKVQSTRKLLLSAGKDIRVVLLKLAEQITNLENRSLPSWQRNQIAKSGLLVLAPLADRLMLQQLKNRIQELAFSTLEPNKYKKLKQNFREYLKTFQFDLEQLTEKIENLLKSENSKFKVKGRTKNIYSIKKKMEEQNLELDDLHDLIGLRIIVESKKNCYSILSTISREFPITTVKDYIANPKPNGYQSIHVIASDNQNKEFEIQIRTEKMERLAENGPWAHWHYKEKGSTTSQNLFKENKWFQDLANKLSNAQSDTLEELRINLFQDRIFVYSPQNEVIELPKGSTPIDYAYRIHSDLGNYIKGAKIDGKLVKLNQKLKNGQKVEIVIDKQKNKKRPTRDWLKYVKTEKAKEHIKKSIKS